MKVNFAVVALPMRNNYLLFFRAVKKSTGCFATTTGHCQGPVYVPVVLTLVGNGGSGTKWNERHIQLSGVKSCVMYCENENENEKVFDFAWAG